MSVLSSNTKLTKLSRKSGLSENILFGKGLSNNDNSK
jgi:hypothetical protein